MKLALIAIGCSGDHRVAVSADRARDRGSATAAATRFSVVTRCLRRWWDLIQVKARPWTLAWP